LKIDQSFIRTIVSYRNNQLIVLWTIDLAHEFDCRVTTKGVEPPRRAIISCLRKSMTFDDAWQQSGVSSFLFMTSGSRRVGPAPRARCRP